MTSTKTWYAARSSGPSENLSAQFQARTQGGGGPVVRPPQLHKGPFFQAANTAFTSKFSGTSPQFPWRVFIGPHFKSNDPSPQKKSELGTGLSSSCTWHIGISLTVYLPWPCIDQSVPVHLKQNQTVDPMVSQGCQQQLFQFSNRCLSHDSKWEGTTHGSALDVSLWSATHTHTALAPELGRWYKTKDSYEHFPLALHSKA